MPALTRTVALGWGIPNYRLISTLLHPRHFSYHYQRTFVRRTLPWIGGTLLDIGCGNRPYEPILSPQIERYVGIDYPAPETAGLMDIIGDGQVLPFASCAFDVVLASEVMEHLPNTGDFLAECARVTKPGGCLLLTIPFMEPIHEAPRDFFRFTPFGLRHLLGQHGFDVKFVMRRGGWWSVTLASFTSLALLANLKARVARWPRVARALAVGCLAPLWILLQIMSMYFDVLFRSELYTLGYSLLAVREARE